MGMGDDDPSDGFTSAGNASIFAKVGVKKDHETGEIVGWKEFY